jgi:hypothetical protein
MSNGDPSMKKYTAIALAALAALCAGCSSTGGKSTASGPAATAAAVSNPTDFPLGPDAKILDAKPFNQTVASAQGPGGTTLSQGAGTYHGHSVIAQSTASLADVKAWLTKLEAAPPAGYVYVSAAQHPEAVSIAAKYGVTYAVFKHGTKGAVIAVIDPKQAHDKLGFMLGLVDKYRMLPASMRGPIDEETKKRTGMSVTEALDPSAPVGMTIEALREVNGSNNPAIVEVDAAKE